MFHLVGVHPCVSCLIRVRLAFSTGTKHKAHTDQTTHTRMRPKSAIPILRWNDPTTESLPLKTQRKPFFTQASFTFLCFVNHRAWVAGEARAKLSVSLW